MGDITEEQIINGFIKNLQDESNFILNQTPGKRQWVISQLGIPDITQKSINEFCKRDDLNEQFINATIMLDTDTEAEAENCIHLKAEIQTIYGFNKSLIARYKSRLNTYRDNLSQKNLRVPLSLAYTTGRKKVLVQAITGTKAS